MAETDRTEGGPFEVGILSDTHGLLRPSVFHALEGVDHILHAGDVGNPDILTALEALAPVTAVWGNTDGFDLRHRVPEVARVGLAGLSVVVLHGHRFGRTPTPEVLREAYPEAGLVVYGHTHRPVMEELGRRVVREPRELRTPTVPAPRRARPGGGGGGTVPRTMDGARVLTGAVTLL
jgi:uncharacterized protein